MASYSTNDPKGWGGDPSRGAALGRPTINDEGADYEGEVAITFVPLDSGGYDPQGTYFGAGEPLYWFSNEEGTIDQMTRAADRDDAHAKAAELYPKAKIVNGPPLDGVSEFVNGYLEAAMSYTHGMDEEGNTDDAEADSVTPTARAQIVKECADFEEANAELLRTAYEMRGYDSSQAGSDFYLTRNGHGAGFWDRGLGEVGRALSEASKPYGSTDEYFVNEEGELDL